MGRVGVFIVDVNVLIDYLTVDPSVLTLCVDHLGPIHIPRRIQAQLMKQPLDNVDCSALGLTVITEDLNELEAAQPRRALLEFPDRLIIAICQKRGWTAITNDGCLRRTLTAEGVTLRWGLEMMLDLVRGGYLPNTRAATIATAIGASNRRIAPTVISKFVRLMMSSKPRR